MSEATTDIEQAPTLGTQDISAMKMADSVVFRHLSGVATIELFIGSHTGRVRVYTRSEQVLFPRLNIYDQCTRLIEVEGKVTSYGDGTSWGRKAHAVASIQTAQYDRDWATIVSLLKPRDRASLHFLGDGHTNDYLRKAGLHADTLHLVVRRGRNTKMEFLLDERVTPDNSARMVKMGGL
jgi:hypothetical protein